VIVVRRTDQLEVGLNLDRRSTDDGILGPGVDGSDVHAGVGPPRERQAMGAYRGGSALHDVAHGTGRGPGTGDEVGEERGLPTADEHAGRTGPRAPGPRRGRAVRWTGRCGRRRASPPGAWPCAR